MSGLLIRIRNLFGYVASQHMRNIYLDVDDRVFICAIRIRLRKYQCIDTVGLNDTIFCY